MLRSLGVLYASWRSILRQLCVSAGCIAAACTARCGRCPAPRTWRPYTNAATAAGALDLRLRFCRQRQSAGPCQPAFAAAAEVLQRLQSRGAAAQQGGRPVRLTVYDASIAQSSARQARHSAHCNQVVREVLQQMRAQISAVRHASAGRDILHVVCLASSVQHVDGSGCQCRPALCFGRYQRRPPDAIHPLLHTDPV